jgi:hypothetical protein
MNTNTPIVPDEIITTKIATSFTVTCRSLELFTTASFLVYLLDQNGGAISSQIINLTTEQYLAWNNNDEYIINLVANALGVTPLPTPEPTPEVTV